MKSVPHFKNVFDIVRALQHCWSKMALFLTLFLRFLP